MHKYFRVSKDSTTKIQLDLDICLKCKLKNCYRTPTDFKKKNKHNKWKHHDFAQIITNPMKKMYRACRKYYEIVALQNSFKTDKPKPSSVKLLSQSVQRKQEWILLVSFLSVCFNHFLVNAPFVHLSWPDKANGHEASRISWAVVGLW